MLIIEARREKSRIPFTKRAPGLAAQPKVCRLHIGLPDYPRASPVAVWPIRDARPYRHATRDVARLVDAGNGPPVAREW